MLSKKNKTMSKPLNIFSLCMILSCVTLLHFPLHVHGENYVLEACSVTRYQDICLKTLASYSNKAKRSPSRWARAGVSVTIGEVKVVAEYVNNLRRQSHMIRGRNKAALFDCVENMQDTLDNLHKSLGVLRKLSYEGFDEQINDVLTWLSAALTDEDTCTGGFEGRRGNQISRLCDKVQNVSYITSNALALANKLATNGLQDLGGDPEV